MSNGLTNIKNHADLQLRIRQLNSLRQEQEIELKNGIAQLYHSMHPINILKNTLSGLVSDKQVRNDATKIGIDFGSDFLIGKLLGSNMNLAKYFSSIILKKASDYVLTNHPEKLAWGVGKLSHLFQSFSKKRKHEETVGDE